MIRLCRDPHRRIKPNAVAQPVWGSVVEDAVLLLKCSEDAFERPIVAVKIADADDKIVHMRHVSGGNLMGVDVVVP